MKYGKFVCEKELPFTQREIDYFVVYFKNLINQYNDSLTLEVEETEDSLSIKFVCDERRFRNAFKSRVTFKGICFQLYKEKGYLDNWDYGLHQLIDPRKPRKNYQDAPFWQYSARMLVYGSEIRYRHRTKLNNIWDGVMPSYLYGTEFNDLDYSKIIAHLFRFALYPIGNY